MVIATLANFALAAAPAGCAIAAGMYINSRDPSRAPLDTKTLAASLALFLVQAVVIPLHGWWRWSQERDTKRLIDALADELQRRERHDCP
jgi:hypothetical protein